MCFSFQAETKSAEKLANMNGTFRQMLIFPGTGGKREVLMWVSGDRSKQYFVQSS